MDIKGRMQHLTNTLNQQNEIYFNNDSENHITDAVYDQLMNELKSLEEQYPEYKATNSPTEYIQPENTFYKVKHDIPMLSLDKVLNLTDLKTWLNKHKVPLNFQYKYDGLANSIIYEDGKLVQASTRGNGVLGEDNTAVVRLIPNVPHTISLKGKVEIRGEILLLKAGLKEINKISDIQYKNVRNAASGIIKNKIPNKQFAKWLVFKPYGLYVNDDYYNDTYTEDMSLLNAMFHNLDSIDITDVEQDFTDIHNNRNNLDFDIDGMVIKCDRYTDWEKLGISKKYPNYGIAYKFPPEEVISTLLDVEWLLGDKGTITPRAKIEPVVINGATVTNPTLHNLNIIKDKDLKIGDKIIVTRHGDVIPEIDSVIKSMRTGNEKEIIPPTVCPCCGGKLTYKNDSLRCDNINCTGRQQSKIINFIKAMEIDNFGPALVEKLYNTKISKFTDIYNLTVEDIANLDKMGEKSAQKVIDNINNSRNNTLDKIIAGLMIPMVSGEKAKTLASEYKTLDKFINAKYSELINLPLMGEVIVDNILTYIKENADILQELIDLSLVGTVSKVTSGVLTGKSFCFTGKLSISRTAMQELIENNGGTNASIKKGVDYLIIGEGAKEHKIEKAKSYGMKVITEEEFKQMT